MRGEKEYRISHEKKRVVQKVEEKQEDKVYALT